MAQYPIHWAEGMFIRPHHFQAADRWVGDLVSKAIHWHTPYSYGLRRLTIDPQSLSTFRLVVRDCQICLPSGTYLTIPEDCTLSPLMIPRDAFAGSGRVLVSIGIPIMGPGRSNVGSLEEGRRFSVESSETPDENDPQNPQVIDYRRPNVRLFLEGEDSAGYETLPIVRLKLGEQLDAPPEIDQTYIPPVLCCDASRTLQEGIIDSIYTSVQGTMETLAAQMLDRGVAFETGHREDHERILKLQVVNEAVSVLQHLSYMKGVHPIFPYLELSRLCGQLAIFRKDRQVPQLPAYDHDDLGRCFYELKANCNLEGGGGEYKKRDFVGAGLQMQVQIDREWVGKEWTFFVGVNSELPYDQCVNLLAGGALNLKIGSSDQVDDFYTAGRAGVRFVPERQPPRVLPLKDWVYFRVKRDTNAWFRVEETLSLAIRMNANYFVEKNINERRQIRIRHDDQESEMSFSLYALPNEASA